MSDASKHIVLIALFAAACSSPADARGPGTHTNDAKFYGPVYGWRYSPPPAVAPEPVCTWATVRVVRNGQPVTQRVRQCS